MKWVRAAVLTATAAGVSMSAMAADMPVKAPVVTTAPGGFYVVLDGAYQVIHLPKYELGWRVAAPVGASLDTGVAVHSFDPRPDGASIVGAIGYRFPNSGLFPFFGSNQRLEVGGSYLSASDLQSIGAELGPRMRLPLLSGNPTFGGCGVGICSIESNLATAYKGWQLFAKLAADHRFGALLITPSMSIFGGRTTLDQTLTQLERFPPFTGAPATYTANSTLRWTDWGARAGFDARFDVTQWLALGLGGTIGFAHREASLNASDAFGANTSSVAVGANATPFLANAEARAFFPLMSNVELKGFVGLNYDSKVPAIQKSSWTGDGGGPTSITPAGIRFESATSYYVGGGMVVKFRP